MDSRKLDEIRAFVAGGRVCQQYDATTDKGASVSLRDEYLRLLLKYVEELEEWRKGHNECVAAEAQQVELAWAECRDARARAEAAETEVRRIVEIIMRHHPGLCNCKVCTELREGR